ncbi:hypothetical protein FGB62_27g00 [Gracilaria domingensis]|nr:hypothetical protein FGB62_27g00 [Gracilaria domingensis]
MGTVATFTLRAGFEHRLTRAHGAGTRLYPLLHVHAAGAPEGNYSPLLRVRARVYIRLCLFLSRWGHGLTCGEPSLVKSSEGHRAHPAAPLPCSHRPAIYSSLNSQTSARRKRSSAHWRGFPPNAPRDASAGPLLQKASTPVCTAPTVRARLPTAFECREAEISPTS